MRVIKATTDDKIYIVDVNFDLLNECSDAIGCDFIEIVRTDELRKFFHENVVMVVDSDGFAHGKPLNIIASAFYQGDIVGDVFFVPEEYGEFVEFSDVDAQCCYMNSLLSLE